MEIMIKKRILAVLQWWQDKPEREKKRIRSFGPLILYTVAVFYGVIYLSILNTVNRYNTGTAVKSWWGGDLPEVVKLKEQQKKDIEESFKALRKRVSGGR